MVKRPKSGMLSGYYYLVTVMDDYSRYILAWELKRDMTADSLIDVAQQAVDTTGNGYSAG